MQEFILRDGEIAFNNPDGTVIIMNVNTYLELQKKIKGENEAHKQSVNRQHALILALLVMLGEAAKKLDEKPATKEPEKILTPSAFDKWARLPKNQAKVDNKPEPDEKVPNVPAFAVDGDNYTNGPYIYVASDGRLFRSAKEVEKFYNLAKNSVSAFFGNKQKYLYQGWFSKGDGAGRWDKKIGLSRIDTDSLWTNVQNVGDYGLSAKQVKQNYNTYCTLVRCAGNTMD